MTKRRDLFVLSAAPGRGDEARQELSNWLVELNGHPGYLGGAVLQECAGELPPDTIVLEMAFESTAAARAMWPKLRGVMTPVTPDGEDRNPPDQIGVLTGLDDTSQVSRSRSPVMEYNRGGGMLGRLLHAHCEEAFEFRVSPKISSSARP